MKNKIYAVIAVCYAVVGFFLFNPLYVGLDLMGVISEEANRDEKVIGGIILCCTAIGLLLLEIGVFVSLKSLKIKKKPFLLSSLLPIFVMLLLRTVYAVLQTWG